MNRIFILVITLIGGLCANISAQDYTIRFLKGNETFKANISQFDMAKDVRPEEVFDNHFYRFVQFNQIPTLAQQSQIAAAGIELLEYIPNNLYVASIPTNINASTLQNLNIRSIMPIGYTHKIGKKLETQEYPSWAMEGGYVNVVVQYFQNINPYLAETESKKLGANTLEAMPHAQMAVVQIIPSQIEKLAKAPFVRYVELISEPGTPESDDGRHLHRANTIDGDYWGARNYDGTGIAFAINDDGAVGPHIDFQGRLNQIDVGGIGNPGGTHGDMTTGIAGGAGNLDPLMRGMATGAYIHVRDYSATLGGTIPLHQDSAVLIFSSSYSDGCNAGYTNTTVLVDQEIFNNPNLMQTFSAGNNNNADCGYGAGTQWGNITGGHKMGKNAIATANLSELDAIISSSSRGPANDGRIKPDISAHGNDQMSTDPNNGYAPGGGTSAAAPGICGVMAQLHQAYQDLNSGQVAPSALLKVTLLATANDLGNDGPDFIYGWGKVNALKAVKVLEDNRYFNATLNQGGSNTHNITIPAGVLRAKIMVYWADRQGSTSATNALVNDLDATVTDPSTTVHLPWLLDHTPNAANLALPATKGADHLNNVEQIAIDNPSAGTYTLTVNGTTIPFGSQQYYVVYEFLYDEITITHPMGGEGLIPGVTDRIHWDAYGTAGTFTIEYTTDNGASWNTITTTAAGNTRFRNWTIPNTVTGQARVRITRGAASDESDANFTIINRPQNIRVNKVCPDINQIQLAWDAVAGATGYDVFMLGQKFMDSIGTTAALTFNVSVANVADAQWFSVRAVGTNGIRGLRQIAINYAGGVGGNTCFLNCTSDNDAGVTSLNSPSALLETCGGITTATVSMTLENKGLFTETNFPVYYKFGNNAPVMQTYTGSLNAGATAPFTFTTPITLPANGLYALKTWTGLATDSTACNDTITRTITVQAPYAAFPYSENFEGGIFPPPFSYIINSDGLRTWEPRTVTGAAGTNTTAMYVDNFSYNAQGQEDAFSFVTLDMSQASVGATAELTFDVAYRRYNNTYSDGLRVDISTDCGQTFNQIYLKAGTALATGTNTTTSWAPTAAANWRKDTVDLTTYVGGNVTLRFVNLCDYGNNIYVDNININVTGAMPPVADFSSDVVFTCDGTVKFYDESGNQPTQWLWSFGDGGVSTQQNPTYTYQFSGTYNVSLQVTNSAGVNTVTKNAYVVVQYPDVTSVSNGQGCPNTSIQLAATSASGSLHWYSGATPVHVGNTFNTPVLTTTTSYQVQNTIVTPTLNVGPMNTIGTGGYHGNTFTGAVNFTAFTGFELLSVWVDADGAGSRTITLWDGNVANGTNPPANPVIAQATVNLVNGPQRVYLNFQVPGPGTYSLGAANADMYRNNAGATYPYTLPNVVSLTGSSATTNPATFYYYFYDWRVRLDSCTGSLSTVTATIVEADFSAVISGGTAAFTDNSTGATSWAWDFGDGNTSTQQNPTHTYTSNGPHLVTLTINNGACSFSDSVSVSVGIEEINNAMNLVIVPNPASEETTLRFSQAFAQDLNIEVISTDGKVLFQTSMTAGEVHKVLDISQLPPAMYLVRLRSDAVVDVRKIVVAR